MKGKNTFTLLEIETLRGLIRNLHDLTKAEQKKNRSNMRRMGFYISDYANTISSDLFEALIRDGSIRIEQIH